MQRLSYYLYNLMGVFYTADNLPAFKNPVITIGTFDGVHKGHQVILKDVVSLAGKVEGESVLITFDPHPRKLIYPEQSLQLLTPLDEKIRLIRETGIDHIVVVPFNTAFASLTAGEYIRDFLLEKFKPHSIVIGYDHRFGQDRTGDLPLLQEAGRQYGIAVYEIPAQKIDEAAVSSTKIRKALLAGQVETAHTMLGQPYSLKGTVIHGAKVGRQLGYPTANIQPSAIDQLIPANGVYAIEVLHGGMRYKGMLNIGVRPTVSRELKLHIEAHLFDFSGDLYDQEITFRFLRRLRDEQKFASLDELKAQLHKDAEEARKG